MKHNSLASPLKSRIIMGAEKIPGGFKAEQIITILDKSDIKNIFGTSLSDEKMLTLISEYLSGWEAAVDSKIVDRDKDLGAFSKIAGLRFMILMLPTFYEQACTDRSIITKDYICKKIQDLFAAQGLVPSDLFDKDSNNLKNLGSNPFAGETPITLLAKDWSNKLKSLSSGAFNPIA